MTYLAKGVADHREANKLPAVLTITAASGHRKRVWRGVIRQEQKSIRDWTCTKPLRHIGRNGDSLAPSYRRFLVHREPELTALSTARL